MTRFGQVSVSRIAYRSPGRGNVHPLDAALNLPEEKHSHGLRKLAAIEAARGSMEAAGAAITRAAGVTIGKRQLEELARRCAAHVEAFYAQRVTGPAPEEWPLVLTFDGKGIVMLPGALRPATAKAAASAEGKLATRLSPGEKNGRKRMAQLACVYNAARSRAPGGRHQHPRRSGGRGKRTPRPRRRRRSRGSRAQGEWLDRLGHQRRPSRRRRRVRETERHDPGRSRNGPSCSTATAPDRGRDRRGRQPTSPSRSSSTSSAY